MEQCLSPADVRGPKPKQGLGIVKKKKKNVRTTKSTAQSDRDVGQSETTEKHGEQTDTQKGNLTTHSELSASKDSLPDISNAEGPEILKKMKKNLRPIKSTAQVGREVNQSEGTENQGEETETKQDSLLTHKELSASNDSLSDNKKSSGILKEMKKMFRPLKSTAQSDREVTQSESTEEYREETNTQKDSLTANRELSASNDSLSDTSNTEGSEILKKMKKNLRPVKSTAQISSDADSVDPLQTHSTTETELVPPENTQKKGGKLAGMFRKSPKPAECSLPVQENESPPTELSASNDSLPDVNTKEKGDKLTEWFRRAPKSAERLRPAQENESSCSELSASNDNLSDIGTKEKGRIFGGMFKSKSPKPAERTLPVQEDESVRSELSASNDSLSDSGTKEKGGIFSGMFKSKSSKPAESTLTVQEDESVWSELSASNDNLLDSGTKEKGGMFSGMFKKPPKISRGPTPAQDNLSTHSEISGSNDSLSDDNTTKTARESSQPNSSENHKEEADNRQDKGFGGLFRKLPKDRTVTFTISSDADSVDSLQTHSATETDLEPPENTQKKGGKLSGLFKSKSSKPAESTLTVQEDESVQSELSASNDSLSDSGTKEKGGIFSGMFRSKSPKRSKDPTPAVDNLSVNSELLGSTDSLSDNNTKISSDADSVDPLQTHSATDTELEPPENTQKKGGKLTGLFRKSPKPAESTLTVQEDESQQTELSASNDSLADSGTKEKGGIFSGIFRSKSPKPASAQVSMDTESGTLAGRNKMPKRRVSFRVKRTLPRLPGITFQTPIKETEEEELLRQSVEMEERSSVQVCLGQYVCATLGSVGLCVCYTGECNIMCVLQESSVEVEMVEIAPLPSESDLLDSAEDDDGLLDWWRTVDGWHEWNESSNFKEDEEELAIEQTADRVFLAAQVFVRLFNHRGASLQQRILELLALADAADNFHKRALQASMGGRVASVVGSVTTITGLILAPFTFGSSIIVTAVGIGVATAGTITSASAHITDSVHFTLDRKKVEKMIEDYENDIKDIQECMEFVQEGMEVLQGSNFEKYTDSVAKRALNRNIKHVVKEGARAGKALMINTDKLVSTVQVLSVAGGAAKAAQAISVTTGVMSALFLALDIFFLAKDSHDLRKGAKTKFAKKLREVCKELQDGILELNRVKTALQKTMDGIEVEEYEEEEEEEDEEDLELKSDPKKLAQLEEEINQIEQKLDQEVLEKKREGEGEGRKETRKNDSKEGYEKPQKGKIENGEKKVESVKEEGEVRAGTGKVESEGRKCAINEMGNQDGNEERKKEKRQGDIKKEKKREGDELGKSGKRDGDGRGKKGSREEAEWRKNTNEERDERRKKEPKVGDERWRNATSDSIPPPARPRSKAISQNAEETSWEGPVTDPKAPHPDPAKRRASCREPLSI
ncbi:uncharacterized protein LOC133137321 isoform X3 [Conger conger]|uniref:uncharacterized protein LOC133137321 isoform X3 n=1 Tax=Conger conger TaxID=82655 RepID=UPI002A5A8473|nr:uncharacterized protein LOC133137321 isoform X3 [Conger conger]